MNFFVYLFLQCIVLGAAISATDWSVGNLCSDRTVEDGRFEGGFAIGLGAATSNVLYGLVAAIWLMLFIGTRPISHNYAVWLHVLGALFFLIWAVSQFVSDIQYPKLTITKQIRSLWHFYSTAVFMTIGKPLKILLFMLIFANMGLVLPSNYFELAIALIGISLGSVMWWLGLSDFSTRAKRRVSPQKREFIQRISGVIIGALAIWELIEIIF